jgi:hypothetical protein
MAITRILTSPPKSAGCLLPSLLLFILFPVFLLTVFFKPRDVILILLWFLLLGTMIHSQLKEKPVSPIAIINGAVLFGYYFSDIKRQL